MPAKLWVKTILIIVIVIAAGIAFNWLASAGLDFLD